MACMTGTRNIFYSAGKLQYYYANDIRITAAIYGFSATEITTLPDQGMKQKPEVLI